MVDVFISYARENKPLVRQLADAVRREGYEVWWDDEIPPHLAYGEVISEKIGAAKAAIVVWSPDSAASEWVRAEADLARGQKKLIQTSVDGREPPMPFNQIQVADIGDWQGEDDHPGWRRVKQSLAALCGPGAAAAAAATAATAPPIIVRPPEPLQPPPRRKGPGGWLVAVAAAATLVIMTVGIYAWSTRGLRGADGEDYAAANQSGGQAVATAAPAEPNQVSTAPALPPTAAFTERATIVAPGGSIDVRSAPTPLSPIVGRLTSGATVTTYPQTGEWRQIHGEGNLFGFVNRANLRLEAVAPGPAPAQSPPAPPSNAAVVPEPAQPSVTNTIEAPPVYARPAPISQEDLARRRAARMQAVNPRRCAQPNCRPLRQRR